MDARSSHRSPRQEPPSASDARPEISVVLPIFNEAESIAECLTEVTRELQQIGISFEIICVDDGSSDQTGELLDRRAQEDRRLVPVHFSRNFGKEAALWAGLQAARGQGVLLMDADLQHPPSLIPEMVARWREGYDLVDAVKADRGKEGLLYAILARVFYALIGRDLGRCIRDASDFKLVDRQVVDILLEFPERNRFLRGLVAWVGFRVARVPFQVHERRAGTTKWPARTLVSYTLRNIVAFSSAPLRAVAWIAFSTVGAAALLAIWTLYYYFSGRAVSGFTTVILVVLILAGLILTSVGVLALYVASIYDEQKARPPFVVRRPRPPLPSTRKPS